MITTKGRLLTDVQLVYAKEEIRISEYRLQEGEDLVILIDTYYKRARLYAPFAVCGVLASRHQYELVIHQEPESDRDQARKSEKWVFEIPPFK